MMPSMASKLGRKSIVTIKTLLAVTGPTHSNDDLKLSADLASGSERICQC